MAVYDPRPIPETVTGGTNDPEIAALLGARLAP